MTKEALWTKPFLLTGGVNFFQLFTQYILITTLPSVSSTNFMAASSKPAWP